MAVIICYLLLLLTHRIDTSSAMCIKQDGKGTKFKTYLICLEKKEIGEDYSDKNKTEDTKYSGEDTMEY